MDSKLIRIIIIFSIVLLVTAAAVFFIAKKIENNNLPKEEKTIIIEKQVQLNNESLGKEESAKPQDIEREPPLSGPLLN